MKWVEIQEMWELEGVIKGVIQIARRYGASEQEVVKILMADFQLSEMKAKAYFEQYSA